MKFLITAVLVLTSFVSIPQDNSKIVGDWKGDLVLPNGKLALVFHITE